MIDYNDFFRIRNLETDLIYTSNEEISEIVKIGEDLELSKTKFLLSEKEYDDDEIRKANFALRDIEMEIINYNKKFKTERLVYKNGNFKVYENDIVSYFKRDDLSDYRVFVHIFLKEEQPVVAAYNEIARHIKTHPKVPKSQNESLFNEILNKCHTIGVEKFFSNINELNGLKVLEQDEIDEFAEICGEIIEKTDKLYTFL